jgi:hypothetical protein
MGTGGSPSPGHSRGDLAGTGPGPKRSKPPCPVDSGMVMTVSRGPGHARSGGLRGARLICSKCSASMFTSWSSCRLLASSPPLPSSGTRLREGQIVRAFTEHECGEDALAGKSQPDSPRMPIIAIEKELRVADRRLGVTSERPPVMVPRTGRHTHVFFRWNLPTSGGDRAVLASPRGEDGPGRDTKRTGFRPGAVGTGVDAARR